MTTMTTMTLEQVQAGLPDLLARLRPGEAVTVTDDGRPVATVTKADPPPTGEPAEPDAAPGRAGCYRRPGFWMAPDSDAPLDEFREAVAPPPP